MLWAKHFYFLIISKLSNHMTRTKEALKFEIFKYSNILLTWWIASIKEQLWTWGHYKYFGSPWPAVGVVSDLLMRPETRSVDTRAANFTELPPGQEEYFGRFSKHSWKSIREKMFTQHRSIWHDSGKHFECSLECNLTI